MVTPWIVGPGRVGESRVRVLRVSALGRKKVIGSVM